VGAFKTMRRLPVPATHLSNDEPISSLDPPRARIRVLWLALAACASILLLATTSQITQEIAVIPFLWVLPLAIYLLTFILCFDSDRWYSRIVFTIAFFVISAVYAFVISSGPGLNLWIQVGVYSLLLFVCCMICHGELVNLKPPATPHVVHLMISIGGR
jgi:peptidoglycan/LPS O-acetylase OafA/YrhL